MIGLPFQSGHVLALRRFPASSRYSRIALTHAVRFAVLAAIFAMPLAGQTGTPLTLPEAVSMVLGKIPCTSPAIADTRISAAVIREARSQLMLKIMFTESRRACKVVATNRNNWE